MEAREVNSYNAGVVNTHTERRGDASRLGTSVAVHHSSSETKSAFASCPRSPSRVRVLCVPGVVGEAVWKVDWGVLYVTPHCRCSAVVAASVSEGRHEDLLASRHGDPVHTSAS
jgi:hypothetical protein